MRRQVGAGTGEFVYELGPHEFWGKRPIFARLLEPGTSHELLPHLENARIVRVRRGLLVSGQEVIVWASKSKGERCRQSWICTQHPIADSDWPAPPRDRKAHGFDPADDDAE